MGVRWTEEQQKVIRLRDRNILVSAAAGSGKTAVLVERILAMLTDEERPVDMDQLLVVTFTEAAAAEMKERIRDAIEKQLLLHPDNERLKQQATLVHHAQVTTIHSFCLSVIRDHFHMIDIEPGFRVAEEGELKLLRRDVLSDVLEEYYAEGRREFLDFAEAYGGRDGRKMEDLILRIYEFSRSYPDPAKWMEDCVRAYCVEDEDGLQETEYFRTARERTRRYMEDAKELLSQGRKICAEADGPYMYEEMLRADQDQAESFLRAVSYRDFYEAAQRLSWSRLASNRDSSVSKEKADMVKEIREEAKRLVRDAAFQYFAQDPETVLRDLRLCRPMVKMLAELTEAFAGAFEEKKKSRNMIDFNDMEQYALRILTVKKEDRMVPSAVAEEYQERFREIMIDEYQDGNLIQEAVLTSVSGVSKGRYNIFMVGDVKQSIYRFRLSRPELFMEKFDTYSMSDSCMQRIDLHKNFRSRGEVLDSVNFLFRQIMTRPLGGIVYDDRAALYAGASYPDTENSHTEVIMVSRDCEEDYTDRELEARAVAGRIKRLMAEYQVTDKKDGRLRPVRYSDIVILTRSMKGMGDVFGEVLSGEGIPVFAGTGEGYFETQEIGVLLDYLRVLNNRRQDIPLAAVLTSAFGGISGEELAQIRGMWPEKPFFQAVFDYASQSDAKGETAEKLRKCMGQMDRFRDMIPYTPLHELLWKILEETGYGDYVSALPGGSQRRANVEMLVEKSRTFERTSYRGLFHFIRYIEQLQKYDVDYGEANLEDEQSDSVRIMSIHKSKGLEFPVVIAVGMGRRFNQQDLRRQVLTHAALGLGMDAVDLAVRTKAPSFPKRVIQREEALENLGEELRILYVAFTRAREKLIITGTLKQPEEKWDSYGIVRRQEKTELSFGRLAGGNSYWDWILPALVRAGEDSRIEVSIQNSLYLASEASGAKAADAFTRATLEDWDTQKVYDGKMREILERQFCWEYPHSETERKKQMFSVSELKKRAYAKDEESGGEYLYEEPEVIPLIPKFMQGETKVTGASRGSAYHRVLELLDFAVPYTEAGLHEAVEEMKRSGKLDGEMAECVRLRDIQQFLQCESGRRMRRAAERGKLWREQPFVLGVPMREIYPDVTGEETILVQGIIDVYFEEGKELVLLDYKTDRVSRREELTDKYRLQLDCYAKALEQITGKKVKEKIIYSFALESEILC